MKGLIRVPRQDADSQTAAGWGSFPVNHRRDVRGRRYRLHLPGWTSSTVSTVGEACCHARAAPHYAFGRRDCIGNPTLVIDNTGRLPKGVPGVLAGRALCKVDARSRPIRPGDLIVTSETPVGGMAGEIDSFAKIGTRYRKGARRAFRGDGDRTVFVAHL